MIFCKKKCIYSDAHQPFCVWSQILGLMIMMCIITALALWLNASLEKRIDFHIRSRVEEFFTNVSVEKGGWAIDRKAIVDHIDGLSLSNLPSIQRLNNIKD